MPYSATYYLNLNIRGKSFDGYRSEDTLAFVGVIEISDDLSLGAALDQAFYDFNRVDKPVPVLDAAEAPSMSVGDVVRLAGQDAVRWFVVERVGFNEIDAPINFVISTEPISALLDEYLQQGH